MDGLIEKYKKIPQTVKVSYWFVICNLFQKGLTFITMPIYTRLLSTTEYGTYSVYTTWAGIISIFASLSLSSAGFFYVGILKYKGGEDKFLSSIQGLSTTSTIIVFGICCVFNNLFFKLTGLNVKFLIIMFVHELFSTPLLYWSAKQRFEYKYIKVVAITIFSSVATVIVSLLLIYQMLDRSYSLILGAAIVQVIVGVFFYIYNLNLGKVYYNKYVWKYAISFGVALIPHYLAYSILNSSDRVMINNICGASDAGIYSLACQISGGIGLMTSAIDASLSPWTYRKLQGKEYKKIARMTNYIIFVLGIAMIGCLLVAPEILLLIAPGGYQPVKWVMPPVIVGHLYLYIAGCLVRVAFYHEKKYVITLTSIFAAILNIILNLLFIPFYGFMAAAYTTLISYMIFALFHYIMMCFICKKNDYKRMPFDSDILLVIALAITLVSIVLMTLYQLPILRYIIFVSVIILILFNKNKIVSIYNEIKER